MKKRISIVEDEPDIAELISIHLEKSGFNVQTFGDGGRFFEAIKKKVPDLLILDLMLPDMDGLEICKSIRKDDELRSLPIIMLTAKGDETDKVLGLELGADDYVSKPFSPKELVARVKAVLRRHGDGDSERGERIEIGQNIVIDPGKHSVSVGGKKIELTATEFKILKLLSSRKGWVFTREKILDYLWGDEKAVVDRTVDVHIRHLREKLGSEAGVIKNVRGVGYRLEE